MTWTGRWSLQGDVLAGDQSHQLAGKHRDAEMLGLPMESYIAAIIQGSMACR